MVEAFDLERVGRKNGIRENKQEARLSHVEALNNSNIKPIKMQAISMRV